MATQRSPEAAPRRRQTTQLMISPRIVSPPHSGSHSNWLYVMAAPLGSVPSPIVAHR